jgi:Holliday junction resolvase RusA-like endonuclease
VASWGFVVLGKPAPQGSKTARWNPSVGKAWVVDSNPEALYPWRQAIAAQAPPGPCLEGPVALYAVFTVRRPASQRKRDLHPFKAPDLDKYLRSLDSITDAGLWFDDGQVAEIVRAAKVWPGYDDDALDTPGMLIAAIEMTEPQWRAELMMKVDVTMDRYRLDRVNRTA